MLTVVAPSASAVSTSDDDQPVIRLRAYGVPDDFAVGAAAEALRQIMSTFRQRYPWIEPVSTTGLTLPGGRTMDMVPFMQIAGDIAPDVMYVNFRQSDTYISMKLLYPLDQYVERVAGVTIPNGANLPLEAYLAALRRGPNWLTIEQRVPEPCWPVMRRHCPYGRDCPHMHEWGIEADDLHEHVFAYPIGALVMAMSYDRSLFAEYASEGIEQRAPRDWEEMERWATILTDPSKNQYGMGFVLSLPSWQFLSFLYSAGGRVVEQNEQGQWYCVLDSEEAVEAAWFFARLRLKRLEKDGRQFTGVLGATEESRGGDPTRFGMRFTYLDARFLSVATDQNLGFGPVPRGPTGLRGSEFNSMMCGIFAGLGHDERRRDAAWKYIEFYDGPESRQIITEQMVQAGMGQFVRPELLRQFNTDGRYDAILRQIPPELEEVYTLAMEGGVPEPYGRNCQYVYDYMRNPLGEITKSSIIYDAVNSGNEELGKQEIRRILKEATERTNVLMIGNLPPEIQRKREWVAWGVILTVMVIFTLVFRFVFRAFRSPETAGKAGLQLGRYRYAYVLMAPAIFTIAMWMYWPLARGTTIAFQNYSVLGDSVWVGAANFAEVLYDGSFWYSLRVSLTYALMFLLFGFFAPIILAMLLQEVPRGKTIYRTIYYLPAVLSGVVVIFLWKNFYSPDGMINQVFNGAIYVLNTVLPIDLPEVRTNWLDDHSTALFWCLLPIIWAGMGPGCLIYLAALKTVSDDLYEAADIDGAGIMAKVMNVALPSIKSLVMINFIGAMIGAVRGAGSFMLAMTGGGPYDASGGATEVIGLQIFYTTFGYLKFGVGAAMAWVLGAMLIGFTVVQLQRLSRLEFRTADKVG